MDEVVLHKGFNERERRTAPKFTVSPDEAGTRVSVDVGVDVIT